MNLFLENGHDKQWKDIYFFNIYKSNKILFSAIGKSSYWGILILFSS